MTPISQTLARADACTPGADRKARKRKVNFPYFKVSATVSIYLCDGQNNGFSSDAKIRVSFYIWNRDNIHSSGRIAAQVVFQRFGVNQKLLDGAEYEVSVDEYIAVDARYVRNPENEPIQAFYGCEKKDEARLIKQRRLVPESIEEMRRLYDPQPVAPVAKAPEAASC